MLRRVIAFAVAVVAVAATAFAQEEQGTTAQLDRKTKFYSVVPKHEFTINGFGGVSTLVYTVDQGYTSVPSRTEPYWRGEVWSDFVNLDQGYFNPTGFGGGIGFSYIWHFHPNVGLMTGLDLAYYSGGIRDLCPAYSRKNNNGDVIIDEPLTTAYLVGDRTGSANSYLVYYGVYNYSERQDYMALQVPVMLHFMAPMGRGNNHFYFSAGAKFGLGVSSTFEGYAVGKTGKFDDGGPRGFPLTSTYVRYFIHGTNDFPYRTYWTTYNGSGDLDVNQRGHIVGHLPFIPFLFNSDYEIITGDDGLPVDSRAVYPWYQGSSDQITDPDKGSDIYHPKGKWGAKLVNVMVSAELGFRWKLTRGWGLYTALYADYGIPTVNKEQNVAIITGDISIEEGSKPPYYETHSLLNAQTAPIYMTRVKDGGSTKQYMFENIRPLAKAHTLGFGLKMKVAFGKVGPGIPPPPPVLPKPDTVIVRDTVERMVEVHDTVYVRDTVMINKTVTKTVTVTDTVTVIKEVPVEIQQYMRELSGGLFKTGSYVLNKSTAVGLNRVADWIKEHPDIKVEIAGYTDSVGSDANNLKLSQLRAKSVYTYLVGKGCNGKKLSYKGYGEADPVADNDTAEGRAANRRVELHVLD